MEKSKSKTYKAIWLTEELATKVKVTASKKKLSIIDFVEYLLSLTNSK